MPPHTYWHWCGHKLDLQWKSEKCTRCKNGGGKKILLWYSSDSSRQGWCTSWWTAAVWSNYWNLFSHGKQKKYLANNLLYGGARFRLNDELVFLQSGRHAFLALTFKALHAQRLVADELPLAAAAPAERVGTLVRQSGCPERRPIAQICLFSCWHEIKHFYFHHYFIDLGIVSFLYTSYRCSCIQNFQVI